jgi:hypothetical protein
MKRASLISDAYLALLRELHARPRGFGQSGRKHAAEIIAVASATNIRTILDYGCGAGTLKEALHLQGAPFLVREYDPAISGRDQPPAIADLCVCTDVLEHVEPDRLSNVLTHIRSVSSAAAFLVIATTLAHKHLPDGRNAHLIVESADWWTERVTRAFFDCVLRSRFVRRDSEGAVAEVSMWLVPPQEG